MKIKKHIAKLLLVGMLANDFSVLSNAGTLSPDTRYETFEDSFIRVADVLEEDKVDIEVEGKTLVNGLNYSSGNDFYCLDGTVDSDRYIEINADSSNYKNFFIKKEAVAVKPSTTYTFLVEILENTLIGDDGSRGYCLAFGGTNRDYDVSFWKGEKWLDGGITGKYSFTLETKDDFSDVKTGDRGFVNTRTTGKIKFRYMIVEGDHTDKDIDYFEGMKSIGEKEDGNHNVKIKSHGKNIFDLNNYSDIEVNNGSTTLMDDGIKITTRGNTSEFVDGYMRTGINTSIENMRKYYLKYLIRAEENTEYSLSYNVAAESVHSHDTYIEFRDKDYKSLGFTALAVGSSSISNKFTIMSPKNTKYVHIRFDNNYGGNSLTFSQIQLEEAEKPTSYEKHISDEKKFILNEPLKSLPNGIKDKIVKRSGQWYIERNVGETVLDGSEGWNSMVIDYYQNKNIGFISFKKPGVCASKDEEVTVQSDLFAGLKYRNTYSDRTSGVEGISVGNMNRIYIFIDINRLETPDGAGFRKWLSANNVKVVYELENTVYEPLNVSSKFNLYTEITYILNDSSIPLEMKVTIDRVANRAKEFADIARLNPTVENISRARMWINLMKESILKDEFQFSLDEIDNISDLPVIEKKEASVNTDIYIKPQNMLSMTLSTNNIAFEDFDSTEDMEKLNALNITVASSLPYSLNAYLETEIQNKDKTNTLDKSILNIKESSQSGYKVFSNINNKVVLKDNNLAGKETSHNIDLKLDSSQIQKADVYKTTVKFEVEQK